MGTAPSSDTRGSDASSESLQRWPRRTQGKFRVGGRQHQAPGPMEARGELDPSRESAGGDLLLALLARRADLRRGGCPTERLH